MQQAVLQTFPNVAATYKFTMRDKDIRFSEHFVDLLRQSIARMGKLRTHCSKFTNIITNRLP